ncbi:MAG: FtsX-like permease family protein, partial [Bacteroidota bacterium]
LVNDFPEIEQAGRFFPASWLNQVRSLNQTKNFYEERIAFADPEFLDILDLTVFDGNCVEAMKEPRTIIISHSKAAKYFPGTNPIGEPLILNNDKENPYKVVGVYKDLPANAHLEVDFILTLNGVEFWPGERNYWGANIYSVYVLLREGSKLASLDKKLANIIENYYLPSWEERNFANPQEIADNLEFKLQPIQEIFLGPSEIRDKLKHGNIQLLWLFGISAALILFIAIINFVNLSIARYSIRIKELSMRKILGASRKQLINQFLTESVLYSFLALSLGLLLAYVSLPVFGNLLGQTLSFPIGLLWGIPIFFLLTLALGILTGLYPAVFLANVKTSSWSIRFKKGGQDQIFQKSLVVFQFIISATLIICTIAVLKQTRFILDKDIGFEKEQVLVLKGTHTLGEKLPVFKEEIQNIPGVKQVAVSDYLPVGEGRRYMDSFWEKGKDGLESGINAQIWQVDESYIQTLGIHLRSGRDFDNSRKSDSVSIIISETLANRLHLKEVLGSLLTNKEQTWRVIGVIDDFHFESLKNDITPICMVLGESPSMMAVKVNTANAGMLIQTMQNTWAQFIPSDPFRYEYLDQSFAMMHKDIMSSSQLFNIFSALAILIACLGLFGLSAFSANQRERELGIRKVLGASFSNIMLLISRDYIVLVLIASLCAIPLGWYLVMQLFKGFAYRADIDWLVFVLAISATIGIAMFSISFQCIKVARKNPIGSIKEV